LLSWLWEAEDGRRFYDPNFHPWRTHGPPVTQGDRMALLPTVKT